MSRLLAGPVPRISRRTLRPQTAWYNRARDLLALEIRQASQARHQATAERDKYLSERLEREQEMAASQNSAPSTSADVMKMLVDTPNSGELLTYEPGEEIPLVDQVPIKPGRSGRTLPKEKLRALVDLYNQTSSFLTPETLDRHIDNEFAIDPRRPTFLEPASLRQEVERKNAAPELVTSGLEGVRIHPLHQSTAERKSRAKRLTAALWGVDVDGNPALEALGESERLRERYDPAKRGTEGTRRLPGKP